MEPTRIVTNDRLSTAACFDALISLPGQVPGQAEDIHGQTREVLAKVDALLAEAGSRKERILSAIIHLKDIARDFAALNEVWIQWLPTGQAPSRTTIQVELAYPSVLVEITVVVTRGRLTFHGHKKKETGPPMKTLVSSTLALSLSLVTGAAQAEELSSTLEKVADSDTITLGYHDALVSFSYSGDNGGQPMGYLVELAGKAVEWLKSTLGKPELKVKYNLVTSQIHTPLAQNGTADLERGSTGVTVERQKQVAFSYGFIYVKGQLLTRKDSGTAHFDDLKGKNVVTTAGITNERYPKNYNIEYKLGMSVVSAKDHGGAFQMLQSGCVVAFYMDDALLYGERVKVHQPYDWMVAGEPQLRETYSCMVRKDDPQFLALVNETLVGLYCSGEIQRIYRRWFQQPIPPKGLNLEFPMIAELKVALENPISDPVQ